MDTETVYPTLYFQRNDAGSLECYVAYRSAAGDCLLRCDPVLVGGRLVITFPGVTEQTAGPELWARIHGRPSPSAMRAGGLLGDAPPPAECPTPDRPAASAVDR